MIGKISIFHIKFHCKYISCILTYTKIENISIYLRYSIFRNYEESYYIFKKSNDSQPRKCIFTQNSSKIFKNRDCIHYRVLTSIFKIFQQIQNYKFSINLSIKIFFQNKKILNQSKYMAF